MHAGMRSNPVDMPLEREWRWNERRNGAEGISLYEDRLAWWSANWVTSFA